MTPHQITLQEIDAIVAYHGFTHRDILQHCGQGGRNPRLLAARKHCAFSLMVNGLTLSQTARAMNKDYTTIRYYLGRVGA